MKARLVTINLKGMDFDWFEKRFEILTRELALLEPDVICFQEATLRQDTPLYNQARHIGEKVGHKTAAFCPYGNISEIVTRDQGGIAVTSRWTACDVRVRHLIPGPHHSDNRVALFVTLQTPGGEVGIGCTHLSWRSDETEVRLVQTGLITNELERSDWRTHGRYALLGDFNAVDEEPSVQVVKTLMKDAYRECHPQGAGYTWSSSNPLTQGWNTPDRRIDYIFASAPARINRCDVVLDHSGSIYPSDHFGVFAELEWPEARQN